MLKSVFAILLSISASHQHQEPTDPDFHEHLYEMQKRTLEEKLEEAFLELHAERELVTGAGNVYFPGGQGGANTLGGRSAALESTPRPRLGASLTEDGAVPVPGMAARRVLSEEDKPSGEATGWPADAKEFPRAGVTFQRGASFAVQGEADPRSSPLPAGMVASMAAAVADGFRRFHLDLFESEACRLVAAILGHEHWAAGSKSGGSGGVVVIALHAPRWLCQPDQSPERQMRRALVRWRGCLEEHEKRARLLLFAAPCEHWSSDLHSLRLLRRFQLDEGLIWAAGLTLRLAQPGRSRGGGAGVHSEIWVQSLVRESGLQPVALELDHLPSVRWRHHAAVGGTLTHRAGPADKSPSGDDDDDDMSHELIVGNNAADMVAAFAVQKGIHILSRIVFGANSKSHPQGAARGAVLSPSVVSTILTHGLVAAVAESQREPPSMLILGWILARLDGLHDGDEGVLRADLDGRETRRGTSGVIVSPGSVSGPAKHAAAAATVDDRLAAIVLAGDAIDAIDNVVARSSFRAFGAAEVSSSPRTTTRAETKPPRSVRDEL